jgi:ATP-binding cassette subfamily C protein CydCD
VAGTAPIVLDGASVTYDGRSEPALSPTSLRIEPGEVLALVGPSGCGKSTVVNLLLGFLPPTAGRIHIGDGADLVDLDPEDWRAHIAYVPQRPYLFPGTVADNIRLDRDAPDTAVRRAADQANLDDLPDGLSTVVGEDGAGLSAGQRQRVALARAFLVDASLLVLDEPTANLDESTEADIVATLRRLAAGRTVLVVAHRPALIAMADRVVDLSRTGIPVGAPA